MAWWQSRVSLSSAATTGDDSLAGDLGCHQAHAMAVQRPQPRPNGPSKPRRGREAVPDWGEGVGCFENFHGSPAPGAPSDLSVARFFELLFLAESDPRFPIRL